MNIQELAALAANGTKVYVFDKPEFLQRYLEVAPNGNWAVELTFENCKEYVLKHGYKPILFPLSSLTQEITINGETFVPTEKILEYFGYEVIIIKNNLAEPVLMMPYLVIQKLIEWNFDVFGLIDKGLAIAVTNEFNPYK